MKSVSRIRHVVQGGAVAALSFVLAALAVSSTGNVVFAQSAASTGTWTTVDVPGANWTQPYSVSGSDIVGVYYDGQGYQGFLYNGTSFTTLNINNQRNGTQTRAFGISGNTVVGAYLDASGQHGFIYNIATSAWTTLNFPGTTNSTYPMAVSGNNIVGQYSGGLSFLYNGTTWTTLTMAPGIVNGISGSNMLSFSKNSFYNGTSWVTINNAPGSTWTDVYGIDGDNIVGSYGDASGGWHGFVYSVAADTWTTLDFPGAIATTAYGIDGSTIVGSYQDISGVPHGFLYTTATTSVRVTGITVAGAESATRVASGQTLQMNALVSPKNASNKTVTWSVANGTGSATINASGLLTAGNGGTVTVKATAKDGSNVSAEKLILVTPARPSTMATIDPRASTTTRNR